MDKTDYTRKLNLDISGLKQGAQEATQAMRTINKEFSANVAAHDMWSKSAAGIESKLSQLSKTYEQQEKKLIYSEALLLAENKAREENSSQLDKAKSKYKELSSSLGEGAKETLALKNEIETLQDAIASNDASISSYTNEVENNGLEMKKTAGETERWENKFKQLTKSSSEGYSKISRERDKAGNTVDKLTRQNKLEALSIEDNKKKLKAAESAYKKSADETGKYSDKTSKASAVVKLLKDEISKSKSIIEKNTKEIGVAEKAYNKYDKEIGDLEGSFKKAGGSVKEFTGEAKTSAAETLKLGDIIKANLISSAITGGISKLAGTIKTGLTSAIQGAIKVGQKGLETYSSLEEIQNVVDVTFKDNAESINKWSKSAAKSFGLSELSAKTFAGTIGSTLKSAGIDDNLEDMSMGLTELSADFASFYDGSPEEAFNKIKAGLTGSTQPLKEWGIDMNQANLEQYALTQGAGKLFKEMDQGEKMQLRYQYLMHAGSDAMGDFARNSDSYKNQVEILNLQLENLAITLGEKIYPIAQKFVTMLNDLLSGDMDITEFMDGLVELIESVLQQLFDALPGVIAYVEDMVKKIADSIVKGEDLPRAFMDVVTRSLQGLARIMPDILRIIGVLFMYIGTVIMEEGPGFLKGLMDFLAVALTKLSDMLPDLLKDLIVKLGDFVVFLFENSGPLIIALLKLIASMGAAALSAIPEMQKQFARAAVAAVRFILENIVEAITSVGDILIDGLVSYVSRYMKIFKELFETLPEDFKQAGIDVILGFWEGLKKMGNWLKDKVKWLFGGVTDSVADELEIKSPSRVFMKLGGYTMEGFGDGVDDEVSATQRQISRAFAKVTDIALDMNPSLNLAGAGGGSFGNRQASQPVSVVNEYHITQDYKYNKPLDSQEIYRNNMSMIERLKRND